MGAPVVDLTIAKGKTFEFAYRYAEPELVYMPISGMPSTAPVRLSVPNHGIPDGWPVRIEDVRQPFELNTPDDGFREATVIDASTIELNGLSADLWRPYTTGGQVVFCRPFDPTGCSARMQVRRSVDGPVLLFLSSDPLAERDGDIELDVELASIIVRLSSSATAAISWRRGVYDIELITPNGSVYPVTAVSHVTVNEGVTR